MKILLLSLFVSLCFVAPHAALSQEEGEFSSEWCDKCKEAERDGCRAPCKDEQGVQYFVCLDSCSTRRCEMACTPVEDEPEEKAAKSAKQKKKMCRTCRRQASKQCKTDCADQGNGRKRAICKKKCVARNCDDACGVNADTSTVAPSMP